MGEEVKMIEYKTITMEQMIEYIDNNAPDDYEWFAEVAMENGVYKHLKARRAFCEKYMPEIIPQKKGKTKTDILNKWLEEKRGGQ